MLERVSADGRISQTVSFASPLSVSVCLSVMELTFETGMQVYLWNTEVKFFIKVTGYRSRSMEQKACLLVLFGF